MMKRRKSIIWSLAVAATILTLRTVAGTLLSGGTALAVQKTIPELPVTIAHQNPVRDATAQAAFVSRSNVRYP